MSENGLAAEDEDTTPLNPRRPPRIPAAVAEVWAVAKEGGATSVDIAKLFGVNPRTVRTAIGRVADEELRAIRRFHAMATWVKGRGILDGVQDELLDRIEGGELSKKDGKGKFRISTPQLLTMQAIQVDKMAPLSKDAMMAEPDAEDRGGSNPIAALLATTQEMENSFRTLPEGMKRRISIRVEEEHQPAGASPSSAVEADFSVEDF